MINNHQNYNKILEQETTLIAYLDLSNMFHWQTVLKWNFRIEDIMAQLFSFNNIQEVRVYYGFNERDAINSKWFHARIKKTGAILKTKPVKWIRKEINETMLLQRTTLNLLADEDSLKVSELVESIKSSGIIIEEPKCNFDVEITMDLLDAINKVSGVLLFSGDSDFEAPLKRLKVQGKHIYVVGVRSKVARELFKIADKYIDFGRFYNGKKRYKSENPAQKAGPRD